MSIATRLYIVFTQEINHFKSKILDGGVADQFQSASFVYKGNCFSSKITLYNKRYSQGTVYHVINQLGPPDRRELTNRSSMSNQEPQKNKPCKSLPLEYMLIT